MINAKRCNYTNLEKWIGNILEVISVIKKIDLSKDLSICFRYDAIMMDEHHKLIEEKGLFEEDNFGFD